MTIRRKNNANMSLAQELTQADNQTMSFLCVVLPHTSADPAPSTTSRREDLAPQAGSAAIATRSSRGFAALVTFVRSLRYEPGPAEQLLDATIRSDLLRRR